MKLCGIYLITHTETGLKYVGQSLNIKRRWQGHALSKLDTYLSRSISMHGWAAFTTEVLELCSQEQLNEAEARWISIHDCISPKGFNLTSGGELRIPNEETRAKMAAAKRGKPMHPRTRARMAEIHIGRKLTPESKAKTSAALKGRVFSEETRKKMSESAKIRKARELALLREVGAATA